MTSFAIGIDLGTTYSCVGVVKDGQVKIIHNGHGFSTTASCVAFTKYERLVGDAAKEQGIKNFHNTVFDVKRLMGRKFNEETVQNDMKYWPFKVVNVDGRCRIQVEEKGMTKIYTPEELSAMVLTNMKETAEAYLRQKVKEAVITVPAYFNDSQRQATKDAAKIAGLKVLRIINEPTAAGIAYALDEKAKKQQNILIYDLGGGTFDVTVMVIQNGNFNVKSTSGDTHLGGEDFNTCLVEYCAAEFKKKNGIDLSNNFKALRRLRKACEKAKRLLSHQTYATIEVDGLADYMDFSLDITRGRFEEICFHLFKKTLESVTKALEDAKMDKSKIDEIILVGGSTRIPRIKRIVIDYFKGKKLNNTVHPDEAVAYGAAVQAAILNGNKSALVRNVVIKDVTPLTLGLSTYSGAFSRVIERNSPLPAKGTVVHYTVWDNQKDCLFRIYQGENERYKENIYLGEFTLTGLREAPKGEVEFDAFFEVDENGILDVKITERGTNNFGTITITKNAGYLSKEEIAQMIKNEEKNVEDSRVQKLLAEARNAMETI